MFPFDQLDRLEQLSFLDPIARPLAKVVTSVVKPVALEDALHGTWLGHPLHAVLVQVPIGSFVSATLLDVTKADERAADRLALVGLLSAVPAVAAGATDWSRSNPSTQRSGLVHAAMNTAGLGLWIASLLARRRGDRSAGTRLGLLGTAVIGASGTVGGHLSYRKGLGADSLSDLADTVASGWLDVGTDDLPEGTPVRRDAAGTPVVLVRQGSTVAALAAHCTHQSGPLDEGEVTDGCITCPWHGSRFRLSDGGVEHGPSVHPQPTFDVRTSDGRLEVRFSG